MTSGKLTKTLVRVSIDKWFIKLYYYL